MSLRCPFGAETIGRSLLHALVARYPGAMRVEVWLGQLPQPIEGRLSWRVDDPARALRVAPDDPSEAVVVRSSDRTVVAVTELDARPTGERHFRLEPLAEGTATIEVRCGDQERRIDVDVADPALGFNWY